MEDVGIDIWEKISEIATKNGLGIALALALAMIFFFLLKRVLERHDKDIERYATMIDKKDTQLDNHLDHLTGAIVSLAGDFKVHDQKTVDGCEKIVQAIESQTDIILRDKKENQ